MRQSSLTGGVKEVLNGVGITCVDHTLLYFVMLGDNNFIVNESSDALLLEVAEADEGAALMMLSAGFCLENPESTIWELAKAGLCHLVAIGDAQSKVVTFNNKIILGETDSWMVNAGIHHQIRVMEDIIRTYGWSIIKEAADRLYRFQPDLPPRHPDTMKGS